MKLQPILNEIISVGRKERIHVSKEPVTQIHDTTDKVQGDPYNRRGLLPKPTGFWYGFGDEWIYFIKTEMKSFADRLAHTYKVYVDPSKVYSINSKDKLDEFCDEFVRPLKINGMREHYPEWNRVAEKYSGIEMPVYRELGFRSLFQDENYEKYYWLYTWDISSGCIWRPDGVVRLKEMGSGETVLNPTDRFKKLRSTLSTMKDLEKYLPDYEGDDKEEKINQVKKNIESIKKQMNQFVEYNKDYQFDSYTTPER